MKNHPIKLSNSLGLSNLSLLLFVIFLFLLFFLIVYNNHSINLIDTDIPPTITDDNKLQVTLQDGRVVDLPIRGADIEESPKTECDMSMYKDIGSFTYVEKKLTTEMFSSNADENDRRVELRIEIEKKRDALKVALVSNFKSGKDIDPKLINCNLVLQPDDLIYMKLLFKGPSSSGVTVDCRGVGDARAQIRNPLTTKVQENKDKDLPMLQFIPDNCGIEPLENGSRRFIDELGAVKSRCDPVRNVEINNCRIRGRITARSLLNELSDLSMVRSDHVKRLQQSAAQHVTFSNVQISGRYKGAVHFLPGTHHFTIEDSEILGGFLGMTIHLPADGGWNVIKNNKITGQRKKGRWPWSYIGNKREVISIDSSEHNRIVNNHISDMKYGGIALYRNCGEKSTIRHRIPQYNQIINNVFDYSVGSQIYPTIFIGSRDDKSIKYNLGGVKKYCHDDEGKNGERYAGNDEPMLWDTETVRNSSESNSDWAQHNTIADNQFIKFKPTTATVFFPATEFQGIKLSSKAKKLDNYLIGNELVSNRSSQNALDIQRRRGAGCAVLAGITNEMQSPYISTIKNGNVPYIRNNMTVKYFWDIRPVVELACGVPLRCQNNILTDNHSDTILIDNRSETCEDPIIYDYGNEAQACNAENNVCAEGSNGGDSHTLGCPGGHLIGIQAGCNLEFGKVSDTQRRQILLNRVKVVKASDIKKDGQCKVDETDIKKGQKLVSSWLYKRYDGDTTPNEIKYKCKEKDQNGGDCHINVRHYCEPFSPSGPIL